MRRLFIVSGILVFLAYCWASVVWQNQVAVPRYRLVDIDLLGGQTREHWDGNQQTRFQRLMELENRQYQLPEDAPGDTARPLTADDFARYAGAHPGAPVMMRVRDTSAFTQLLARRYVLRDSIFNPEDPLGQPYYSGGRQLDKAMLDDLLARGIDVITVTGHAPAVRFEIGTALMIALIFLVLVAALKPVVWDPFTVMLEKRMRELEKGGEAQRENQLERDRFESERERRHASVDMEMQALRLEGQREAARAAAEIVRAAREKEKATKLAGLGAIAEKADAAAAAMEKEIPALAEEIARAVTPGGGGPRWDRMER